jgi:hypothetical protein
MRHPPWPSIDPVGSFLCVSKERKITKIWKKNKTPFDICATAPKEKRRNHFSSLFRHYYIYVLPV